MPFSWGRMGGDSPLVRPVECFGRIHFAGGKLLAEDGQPATLRGVSLFWSQWAPSFYNADLVRWLATDWRIDIIRVPIAATPSGYLMNPDAEVAKALIVIDAAVAHGIYVVVDWHSHAPHTDATTRFFETISLHYPTARNLLYEPWNEPSVNYNWDEIGAHHKQVVSTIRKNSPEAPIILGTPQLCQGLDYAVQAPLQHSNVAYSAHFYAGTHRDGLRRRIDQALAGGLAVFVTEWGSGEANGNGILDLNESRRWLEFLNARAIGHINWSVCDKEESCAALRPGCPPAGQWRQYDLSASGRFVRDYLRGSAKRGRRKLDDG